MLAIQPPKIYVRCQISTYIIVVVFTITRLILTYLDKQYVDTAFILDLIFGILLLSSLTINLFLQRGKLLVLFIINVLLLFINFIIPFFEYLNVRYTDFKTICTYMIIIRMFINFANDGFFLFRIDINNYDYSESRDKNRNKNKYFYS